MDLLLRNVFGSEQIAHIELLQSMLEPQQRRNMAKRLGEQVSRKIARLNEHVLTTEFVDMLTMARSHIQSFSALVNLLGAGERYYVQGIDGRVWVALIRTLKKDARYRMYVEQALARLAISDWPGNR